MCSRRRSHHEGLSLLLGGEVSARAKKSGPAPGRRSLGNRERLRPEGPGHQHAPGRDDRELFLGEHGYLVAPVTIDNDEYIFAAAYDRSFARGAADVVRQVADAYVPYMEAKVDYFERNSRGGMEEMSRPSTVMAPPLSS